MLTPDELSKLAIGLDDEFRFKCRACGKCCKHRHDIILTPRDLFNIAQTLQKSIGDIVSEYCELYVGHSSKMPIVRLLPRGKDDACPFLSGKLCTVNDKKPVVCALFPIGRIRKHDSWTTLPDGVPQAEYIFQRIDCGSTNRKQTVRKWLERYNIPIDDPFDDLWNETVMLLTSYMHTRKPTDEDSYQRFVNAIGALLYFNYDLSADFLPQFERNAAFLADELRAIMPDK